jgi:hypothetical protein
MICSTGNEDIGFDLETANTAGLVSTTGVTTIDCNDWTITDVAVSDVAITNASTVGFTTAYSVDINSPEHYKLSMGAAGAEFLNMDFDTTNTVGISSDTGVTTIDFNNIIINDVNIGTDVSFDQDIIDANTTGSTDPNDWITALGGEDAKGIRYWFQKTIDGTTYYIPAFTEDPTSE